MKIIRATAAVTSTAIGVLMLAAVGFAPMSVAVAQQPAPNCKARIAVDGFPRISQSLAELSAIQNWLEQAVKLGETYAVWHHATGQRMKCEGVGGNGLVRCSVVATPCAAPDDAANAGAP